MTATTNPNEQPAHAQSEIEVSSQVPRTALVGDQISCKWQLTNNCATTVAASFYLRTTPARLAALACSNGNAVRGHYHGSAALQIPAGATTTIAALLEPRTQGEHLVRVALLTRQDSLLRLDSVSVSVHADAPPLSRDEPAPRAPRS
jgi:hypothetical protein